MSDNGPYDDHGVPTDTAEMRRWALRKWAWAAVSGMVFGLALMLLLIAFVALLNAS
jgi:hypothetical protein